MGTPRGRCRLCRYHGLRTGRARRNRIRRCTYRGESLSADEVFGSIEAVKTVSDLLLPIEGEVLELNPELEDQPELVNNDPYGKGWIIKIKPANAEDVEGLLSAADYTKLIAG